MDFGIFFGLFALVFGLYTLVARHFTPEKFVKLKIMQEKLGEKQGFLLHVAAYTVLPIFVGISILLRAFFPGQF